MKILMTSMILALSPALVAAHSDMNQTVPENGAVLSELPEEIGLNFTDKLRLTAVKAHHSGGDTQSIDLADHTGFETEFTLTLPPMGAGTYDVEWRGLGLDGHAMQGSFRFEVE